MELTFRLTREDLQHCGRLAVARVREHAGWRASTVVISLIYGFALLVSLRLAHLAFGPLDDAAWIVAGLAWIWGALSVLLLVWYFQQVVQRNFWPDDSPSLSEVRLKLAGDCIEASDGVRSSRHPCHGFSEISQSGDLIIIWFDRAQGVVVPTRAFADDDAREAFVGTVRAHLGPAPAKSGHSPPAAAC